MKKATVLLLNLVCILLLVSCNFSSPLKNKMINYYSEVYNYKQLVGKIQSIDYRDEIDELYIEIELINSDSNFTPNAETSYYEFVFVNWSKFDFLLQQNDNIIFLSAPTYFYNGHTLPVVQLEKNGQEYLSFSDGVKNYIEWIKQNF